MMDRRGSVIIKTGGRVLAVVTGWAAGVWATTWTQRVPLYGKSLPGDDPLALAVALVVGVALWRVAGWIYYYDAEANLASYLEEIPEESLHN